MSDEIMAGGWTRAKLAAKSAEDRHTVWKKARSMGTPEALALVRAIEELGLPYSDPAALRMDDPVTIKMHEIINAPDGRAACLKATDEGMPAIAGVDPMLNTALGVEYRGGNMATHTAGTLVGELMRSLGYVHGGQRPLPKGCVAKTGAFWVVRKGQ